MDANSLKVKNQLPKSPTGISGLDEITFGGLPAGRATLVAGSAGSGKTLLGMEFLVRGATEFGENGVFMAFEETDSELIANVESLGFRLNELVKQKKIVLDHVHIDPREIEETGEYDLEGLFIRIEYAVKSNGAKRVVLDTIESLFSGFSNPAILRAELRRLFRWLKDKGLTAIITGERGDNSITRQGLEEYVSDCVIVLDHRVMEESSTRRLRILKYRGSMHGTNEYPFLIDETGFSVLPITSIGLTHEALTERISSGVPELDSMMENKGFYKGSSVLVSGTAGTGKSSLSAVFASAACQRGEKVLYFSLEESPSQIIRNMKSINIELEKWEKQGLLKFQAMRPTMSGLEMHLTTIHKEITKFNPEIVIVDPVNSFVSGSNMLEARAMSMRLIDFLKIKHITGFFTYLTKTYNDLEHNFISSLIDTWILLRDIEISGERNRGIFILKSRGMKHSNQIREFILSGNGIKLVDVYTGMDGVLTGSSRMAQEARNSEKRLIKLQEIEHMKKGIESKRKALISRIEAMKAEFEAEEEEMHKAISVEKEKIERIEAEKRNMAESRGEKTKKTLKSK
ncbi:MAG TPA: circadian clock protein KaiC [Bacteroidales bacterium]|nr:circadian clock protein KaiC [Bacteroidales bacterium]